MRRSLALVILLALFAAAAAGAKLSAPSWAQSDIRLVVSHGLMAKSAASFRPDDPLTQGELAELAAGLSDTFPTAPLDRDATVTVAQLDAKLVGSLGLSPSATRFLRIARAAGLQPPARFGTEVVARLLALRVNHPAGQDTRELRPDEPATRAEAAYSAARILRFAGWEVQNAEEASAAFALPSLDAAQRRVLKTAVGLIGLPYIWGGTSDRRQAPFGVDVNGGFDCSGFVWRVFKQPYPGAAALSQTLVGRTAAAMAGEVAPAKRIGLARLAPADLVFFGAKGPRSKPAQVDHMGVYLGGNWMIHSSRYGVALAQLTGWYAERFAWGRRPLVEAGIAAGAGVGATASPR